MILEEFTRGSSFLHRCDARGKIIANIAFIGVIAGTGSYLVAGAGLLFSAALSLVAGLSIKKLLQRLVLVNSFTLLLWLILPFTYGGTETISMAGNIQLSIAGVKLCALITLKTNAIVLSILSFLSTSTIAAVGHGLLSLGLPKRLAFLLLFSYRNIMVIYGQYKKLLCAASMRCFSPTTSMHTYRTYGYLFGMTLVRSWNRGEKIQEAMLMRGFDGKLHPLHHSQMRNSDYTFLVFNLIVVMMLFCLNYLP